MCVNVIIIVESMIVTGFQQKILLQRYFVKLFCKILLSLFNEPR